MKKSKACYVICIALILALSACGGNGSATQGENNPDGGTFVIEQIQDNPRAYLGEITLAGIVGDANSREFVLQNDANTFEVTVDFRGNQAFPQVGNKVIVDGQLIENSPCCGGGFSIISTRFELVE